MNRGRLGILLLNSLFLTMVFFSGCAQVFGPLPIVTPTSAVILAGQKLQFSAGQKFAATEEAVPLSEPVWYVNQVPGGNPHIGTITASGLYTAPNGSPVSTVQITVIDSARKRSSQPADVSIFRPSQFQAGTVSASKNPLVAKYTFTAPLGAKVQIQFGTTTNYGLTTWEQPAPADGGDVSILVAGMRASTPYHMRALVELSDGTNIVDKDHTFETGAIPANVLPHLTVQQTPGMDPGSGVEMLSLFEEASQAQLTAVITDLAGNVIWYYPIQPGQPFPMKLLPNGHILMIVGGINSMGQAIAGEVREIDLAGNILFDLTAADIQGGLTKIGFPVASQRDALPNHDLVELPNGHIIMIVSIRRTVTGQSGPTTVNGNALIDWDPTQGPVWTWSTFDHIPLSHAPFGTSDLTHGNALLYSADDGNLLFSLRNQNWIVKINYDNGVGDGSILWRLGPAGDFALPNGQAPIEWNYGQHAPILLGPSTSGIFPLMFFNNGNNRLVDAHDDVCGTPGLPPCYSSVPTFLINEYAKTVQVVGEINLSPAYSVCCGSTDLLPNGDTEYDVAEDIYLQDVSYIQEVTPEQNPQLVWQMNISGQLAYRGIRIPSLYPGVEWTQAAINAANVGATPQATPTEIHGKITRPIL